MSLVREDSIPKILQILSRKHCILVLEMIGRTDMAHWTELERSVPRGNLLHLVRELGKLGLIEKIYAPQTSRAIGYKITDLGNHILITVNKLRSG
ncbi:MAG TPA: hypothetical protein VNK25_00525 [Candidatus Nitrosotenuis sp.]|nr:hypothetical protein [Candidatus Nitrosotenuis sp.]